MKPRVPVLNAAILVLILAVGVAAQSTALEDSRRRDEIKTRIERLRSEAEQGDAEAQYKVGGMYRRGSFVPQDYQEARKWYRLMAEQGDAGAQNNLGVLYTFGRGGTQDYQEAAKWYRLAAEQGYILAQNRLGVLYASEEGVPQDYVQAPKRINLASRPYTGIEEEFDY